MKLKVNPPFPSFSLPLFWTCWWISQLCFASGLAAIFCCSAGLFSLSGVRLLCCMLNPTNPFLPGAGVFRNIKWGNSFDLFCRILWAAEPSAEHTSQRPARTPAQRRPGAARLPAPNSTRPGLLHSRLPETDTGEWCLYTGGPHLQPSLREPGLLPQL